ncbi:GPI transamidase component Gpi16 [Kalaharituber pfeilii]|nr:GPI transamidase component Gpi16 [Kalaharituber pfeilii]
MKRLAELHNGPFGFPIVALLLSLLFSFTMASQTPSEHDYLERLLLRPLPGNSLLASFVFKTNGSVNADHMLLFPRSLNQVLQASSTRELHVKFTLGRWNAEEHGAQPSQGKTAGGTGVELWAWVEADDDDEAFARWTTLTNALSGLFCASLNFIDATRTIQPVLSFPPAGDHLDATLSRLHLLHGSLPREPVCTENLTPFLKLLPCKAKVGISTLLDGHRLFDANWQSMSIDVRPVCDSDGDCKLEMEQTVDMVLDIERSLRRRDSPVPKPRPHDQLVCNATKGYVHTDDACFPLDNEADLGWSLSEIFGKAVQGTCPFGVKEGVEAQRVCLEVPEARQVFISVGSKEIKLNPHLRCFVTPENGNFDMVLPKHEPSIATPREQPLLYVERSFTGYGQERGGVQTILKNPSLTDPVDFVYLESLPWFMKPYIHTLSAKINGNGESEVEGKPLIQETYYRPALDRRRGTHLEMRMRVPRNETVVMTYDFEKAVLRYTEYPPDANRGFDIAPAIIALLEPTNLATNPRPISYLRTTSLLLYLPTPDFSMPYNVIILTSTVMALAFGSLFNLMVRRFVPADQVPRLGGRVGRFMRAVKGRLRKGKAKTE